MKKKKGFTLVELLAVIVILAVILVIAVPQIMSVIESARKGSIESTAKLIAEGAEREYTNRKILGKDTNIECSEVANLNDKDYESCSITFDSTGKATVSITGKGKFEGYTCVGSSTNMECTKGTKAETNAQYFSYSDVDDGTEVERLKVTIEDKNKCVSYIASSSLNDTIKANADTLCAGGTDTNGNTIQSLVYYFNILSGDYETAGLNVEWITISNVEVKDKDKCTSYIASSNFADRIKANADTLCAGGKTTDGDTMQSLVIFDGISSTNYETAGLEVNYIVINSIKIKDKDKCVVYLIESWDDTSDEAKQGANTLCSGNALDDGYTLKDGVLQGNIPSSDYETAGLEVTSKPYTVEEEIIITGYSVGTRSIVVKDKDRCISYLTSKLDYGEDMATDVCVTNTSESEVALLGALPTLENLIKNGKILSTDYILAGLEVTYKNGGGTDVVIPSEIDGKKVVGIANYAFTTSGVTPTNITNTKKTSISYLYNNRNVGTVRKLDISAYGLGITSVVIPDTVIGIGKYAFYGNQLTNVTIPNTVTWIGREAFVGNQLIEVTIPGSVKTIDRGAFASNKLTSLTISNGVESIDGGAFEFNQLTNVTIPNSVTSIGDRAFADNSNITIINNSSLENIYGVWGLIIGDGCTINGNIIKHDPNAPK